MRCSRRLWRLTKSGGRFLCLQSISVFLGSEKFERPRLALVVSPRGCCQNPASEAGQEVSTLSMRCHSAREVSRDGREKAFHCRYSGENSSSKGGGERTGRGSASGCGSARAVSTGGACRRNACCCCSGSACGQAGFDERYSGGNSGEGCGRCSRSASDACCRIDAGRSCSSGCCRACGWSSSFRAGHAEGGSRG